MKSLIKFSPKGMFFKILMTLLILLVASYALLIGVSSFFFKDDLRERQRFQDRNQLDSIGQFMIEADTSGWSDEMVLSALKLTVPPQLRSLYIIDRGTSRIRISLAPHNSPFQPDALMLKAVVRGTEGGGRYFNEFEQSGDKTIVAAQAVEIPGKPGLIVMTASNMLEKDVRMWSRRLWLAIGITLAMGIIFALILSSYLSGRLRKLEEASRRIAKGKFDLLIPIYSRDELGHLARSLEQMALELGSLDRMRKEFVANVSHDMRSPLTSMHGYLEAILDGTIPSEHVPRYVRIVQEQNKRLIRLVNDLLDIARIEAGQFHILAVPFNLTEAIRQVLARMEPHLQHHRVMLHAADSQGRDIWVHADSDRIEQVLVNLIQNAVEYSGPDTTIAITVEAGMEVFVSVSDEGIGMEEADLQQIWERFYKTDKARTRKNGTGIGLSIVKAIIDGHRSNIRVHSIPQQGTTFIFTLPLAEGPAALGDMTK
ncbi:ATP-binding protein [Paenibacillus sp. ACRRX]|uniref:sensor histidine kinase n=1 Tax=Paenibacillus sp. ACRRX TaxID=2918206 RepID=UPI001EF62EE1|nr:ATP-binding protein [Paenibacillus sp. ACRRX]MCG7408593.1 ATP-binding protein [Paenibacillus sp. ACRRX]